jgi:hypothetical protein
MLHLSRSLPPAILIGGEGAALAETLVPMAAVWFAARPESVVRAEMGMIGWCAQNGALAGPIPPNQGNSRFTATAPAGFDFETGVHCGLCLPQVAPSAARFTVAMRYSAAESDPRTLLSVNTGQANNMIFLSEADGLLTAKDRGNGISAELRAPLRGAEPHLAVVSFTGRSLILSLDGRGTTVEGRAAGMDLPADLFIGCRSTRSGLHKTLGAARIHDVIFWPDRALLHSDAPADHACRQALDRYHRWSMR